MAKKAIHSTSNFTHQLTIGTVLENKQIVSDVFKIRIHHPEIAYNAQPGQFVNIRVTNSIVPLLRRPFSFYQVNQNEGWFEILFKVVGTGTECLSRYQVGTEIDFIGPLGNSFSIPPGINHAVLIAGGLGIAPLNFLSQSLLRKNVRNSLFWGNSTESLFAAQQSFLDRFDKYFLSTDDGSKGFHGTVTQLFEKKLEQFENQGVHLFACGPTPMLKKLKEIALSYQMPCQVSLETIMACGIGVCMGCSIPVAGADNKYYYVCKNGPVFKVEEIDLNG